MSNPENNPAVIYAPSCDEKLIGFLKFQVRVENPVNFADAEYYGLSCEQHDTYRAAAEEAQTLHTQTEGKDWGHEPPVYIVVAMEEDANQQKRLNDQQIISAARELIAALDSGSAAGTRKLHDLKLAIAKAIGVNEARVKTAL